MKKLLLILTLFMFSCSEVKKEKTADEIVNEASAGEIAHEIAGLNMDVAMARDIGLTTAQRQRYLDHMQQTYVGFLSMATLDNINSPEFEQALNRQKELITKKIKAVYAEELYKIRLKQQMKAEDELREAERNAGN